MSQSAIDKLLEVMRTLRSENGCPWDREQTLKSLKPCLLEETYEVLDAIESGDSEHLKEELGDLLLQIVFQAQISSECGDFSFQDVAATIVEKLIRRHPHVFADVEVSGADEVLRNWDAIKKQEKGGERTSLLRPLPRHLPSLQKADQVQKRAARGGFDWDEVHDVLAKLEEELGEVKEAMAAGDTAHIREEMGDLLFSVVNLSRFMGHNAEEVLDETVSKFVQRFQAVEKRIHDQGREMTDCTLEELETIWNEVKLDNNCQEFRTA